MTDSENTFAKEMTRTYLNLSLDTGYFPPSRVTFGKKFARALVSLIKPLTFVIL